VRAGGAINSYAALTVRDCTFAAYGGGAISCTGSDALVRIATSRFTNNAAGIGSYGGGVYLGYVSAQLVNCVMEGNSAPSGLGGGLFDAGGGSYSIAVTNCLLRGNTANYGGGATA
jgi:hypothetical protein